MKMKTFLYSFFQTNNSYLIQKSMRHADASAKSSSSEDQDDYLTKRQRNNDSVRRSRAKSRAITQECAAKVQELRVENVQLNSKLESLQNELFTLKNLFQSCFKSDNLLIKPNDIPTSTLYKLIMKKDLNGAKDNNGSEFSSPVSSPGVPNSPDRVESTLFTPTDKFYINQIKNSLSTVMNMDSKMTLHQNLILKNPIVTEHDYSSASQ